MPRFYPIKSRSQVTPDDDQWIASTKFNSKNSIVDSNGENVVRDPVAIGYHTKISPHNGRRYLIIAKQEHHFSFLERVKRVVQGILTILAHLGTNMFSKSVRDLFTKHKGNIRMPERLTKKRY